MRYALMLALSGCALATPETVQFTEAPEYQATVDGLWEKVYGGKAPVVVLGYQDAATSGITFAPDEVGFLIARNPSIAAMYRADPGRFRGKAIMGINTLPVHVPLATMAHEMVHVRIYKPGLVYDPTGLLVYDFLARNALGQVENLRAHGPEFQLEAARVTAATGIPIQPI